MSAPSSPQTAFLTPSYEISGISNTVASLPNLEGECASPKETILLPVISLILQFIAGSLLIPVSMAGISFSLSPNASESESYPPFAP